MRLQFEVRLGCSPNQTLHWERIHFQVYLLVGGHWQASVPYKIMDSVHQWLLARDLSQVVATWVSAIIEQLTLWRLFYFRMCD